MISVVGNLPQISLNVSGLNTEINKQLIDLLREASKEFVLKAFKRIPVHTGMSAASLQPLARALKLNLPIAPVVSRIKGKAYTKDRAAGFNSGSFQFKDGPTIFTMFFSSTVFHFALNDRFDTRSLHPNLQRLKQATPWRSFEAGALGFTDVLNNEWRNRRIPVQKFIVINRKRIV